MEWDALWLWLSTEGWNGLKTTGSMAGLITAAERIYDRVQRAREKRRSVLPDIEVTPFGAVYATTGRSVVMVVRSRWRNTTVVEWVRVKAPAGLRLRDPARRDSVERLRIDHELTPYGRGPRYGDVAEFSFEIDDVGPGAQTVTLEVAITLKGAKDRPECVAATVVLRALPKVGD